MSLSNSICLYSNNCLHFLKCAVPLRSENLFLFVLWDSSSVCQYKQCCQDASITSGATTLRIMTLSLTTLSTTTLSITTLSITTLSITTLSISTLSKTTLSIMTLSITTLSITTLSTTTLSITTYEKRHSIMVEYCSAECQL
jgi:hypothetical protein